MKPELEKYLWDNMEKEGHGSPFPYYVILDMVEKGMIKSEKQGYRTLGKWERQGKFEYGCSLRMGCKNNERI